MLYSKKQSCHFHPVSQCSFKKKGRSPEVGELPIHLIKYSLGSRLAKGLNTLKILGISNRFSKFYLVQNRLTHHIKLKCLILFSLLLIPTLLISLNSSDLTLGVQNSREDGYIGLKISNTKWHTLAIIVEEESEREVEHHHKPWRSRCTLTPRTCSVRRRWQVLLEWVTFCPVDSTIDLKLDVKMAPQSSEFVLGFTA